MQTLRSLQIVLNSETLYEDFFNKYVMPKLNELLYHEDFESVSTQVENLENSIRILISIQQNVDLFNQLTGIILKSDEILTADKFLLMKLIAPLIAFDPFCPEHLPLVNLIFESLFHEEVTIQNEQTHVAKL